MQKLLLLLLFPINTLFAQSYTNWITGDPSDFATSDFQAGVVLAGGATDNDDAMQWMLSRAGSGDVVVLRASGSDGYNDYFFSELGIEINSVETIRFNDVQAAYDEYVITQITNAEIIFLSGGDQYDYYQYWKDTPIEDALNTSINEKQITIGGTSAGMAILGAAYYTPPGGSLDSEEALSNPFHQDTEIIGKGDFLNIPILANLITDTHYDQRERWGRHLTFLARLIHDFESPVFGIASNEYTAVCIDENGIARSFGEYPLFDDFTYFLSTQCNDNPMAEVIEEGTPLTWNQEMAAVTVYKLPGTVDGANTFDLNDWLTGEGGSWEQWYAVEGELFQIAVDSICDFSTNVENVVENTFFSISPNPVQHELTIHFLKNEGNAEITITNLLGNTVLKENRNNVEEKISLANLPQGVYFISVNIKNRNWVQRFIKR